MPTIDNPGFYERSSGDIADGKLTQFFRNVSESETLEDTGSTESPIGWVGLLEVDADLVCHMTKECLPSDQFFEAVPDPGFYIVKRDDNGLVWGMEYGYGTLNEEKARADFDEARAVYEAWCESEECICHESHPSTECPAHPTCQGDHN